MTLDGRRVMADQVKLNMTIDLKRATSSWNENKFLFLLKQLHDQMSFYSHKIKNVVVRDELSSKDEALKQKI